MKVNIVNSIITGKGKMISPQQVQTVDNTNAGDENRTRTMQASRDFKSLASASSATPAKYI